MILYSKVFSQERFVVVAKNKFCDDATDVTYLNLPSALKIGSYRAFAAVKLRGEHSHLCERGVSQ